MERNEEFGGHSQLGEGCEQAQVGGDGAAEPVEPQVQVLQQDQPPQLGRHGPGQLIASAQLQGSHSPEVTQDGRNRARQVEGRHIPAARHAREPPASVRETPVSGGRVGLRQWVDQVER